jgi:hypothetical protein
LLFRHVLAHPNSWLETLFTATVGADFSDTIHTVWRPCVFSAILSNVLGISFVLSVIHGMSSVECQSPSDLLSLWSVTRAFCASEFLVALRSVLCCFHCYQGLISIELAWSATSRCTQFHIKQEASEGRGLSLIILRPCSNSSNPYYTASERDTHSHVVFCTKL